MAISVIQLESLLHSKAFYRIEAVITGKISKVFGLYPILDCLDLDVHLYRFLVLP